MVTEPRPHHFHQSFLLLAALLGLRLLAGALFPLSISGDEAYYWDWGRHLAWGYYSKPPMIGWLMGLSEMLIGGQAGIRVMAAVLATVATTNLVLLARHLFDDRVALFTLGCIAVTPAFVPLSLLLTIDPPLAAFWSGTLLCGWLLLRPETTRQSDFSGPGRPHTSLWLLLLICLGGAHLTKQMGWLLPLLLLLAAFAIGTPRRRIGILALVGGLSYLALVPNLLWNAQHDWILFGHTASHLSSSAVPISRHLARFFEFLGSQMLLLSPALFILSLMACWRAIRNWKATPAGIRYLLVLAVPGLTVFLILALKQRVLPNWPLVFWLPMIPLAAAEGWHLWRAGSRWVRGGLATSALITLLLAGLPWIIDAAGLAGGKSDPLVRLRGWEEYARAVVSANEALPGGPYPIVVDGHRYYVAQIVFHGQGHPEVYRWSPEGVVESQYELWGWPDTLTTAPFLLLIPDTKATPRADWLRSFPDTTPVAAGSVPTGPKRSLEFNLFLVKPHPVTSQP